MQVRPPIQEKYIELLSAFIVSHTIEYGLNMLKHKR